MELIPDYAEAWLNLADTYSELKMEGKYREALARGKALGARGEDADED